MINQNDDMSDNDIWLVASAFPGLCTLFLALLRLLRIRRGEKLAINFALINVKDHYQIVTICSLMATFS